MAGLDVLVVEDDPLNRELVHDILARRGHHVMEAESVDEAWRCLERARPAVVLLDIGIPGGGEQLLTRMKKDPRFKDIPVAAVTASAMYGDRERFLELGFDDYLAKPFNVRTFGPRMESLVGHRLAG